MNELDSFTQYVASFVDELVSSGVDKVVISPGSRSTPLAILMAEHPKLTCYINIDERSAGFFALGIAKSQKKTVALLCTSGTAAANYYPAIVEAHYARVPLLILTADRPHELRDVGAPQAIDQIHMYGNYPKWFVDLALPEEQPNMLRYVRTVAARAVGTSKTSPAGVVHLNFPFREPLIPNVNIPNLWSKLDTKSTYLHISPTNSFLPEDEMDKIANFFEDKTNGLIICGEHYDQGFVENVQSLSEYLKFPVIADPLSQLRAGVHNKQGIMDSYDSILKDKELVEKLKPEVVIRFGAMPVSKPLMQMLKNNPDIIQIVVDQGGTYRDPTLNASHLVTCDETAFCQSMIRKVNKKQASQFYQSWIQCDKLYWKMINQSLEQMTEMFEGKIVRELQQFLPDRCTLFVGNSMPIRDVDTFFGNTNKEIKIMANRGASGIDGIVSTALGASVNAEQPTFLLIGDLSFYHDLNGLLAAKMNNLDLTILLVNNDGGGIFSFLPQSNEEKHFETLYGTAIGLDFSKVVDMYNGSYQKVESWKELHTSLHSTKSRKGLKVIEIPTDRKTRVKVHRELLDHVSQEIRKVLK
ncbi:MULTISPECIES: 2-succinyl-5-enolpyruvyl-6-hydroxy-3-cyclohexene-1-carboxylic-acid synthase [Metabacillus]|uniref:2-succinyl-5-enolpyruvyl-6-hydroxy-3-cyclohexene-1-carboxylate synthase n=2 Tax=Metabacillus TaxID=2675233 RepID=A0A179T6A7_9BACI|nr:MULTISPECIES: 2-succinyl-5-enolpyruvyl-6-hydroxy-3-cyclohexene-1-carboxylic-acid synthase [Metabacillus]OAS88669.1 2-succinyl-5-enolpyruvyl-6-hydroxy-3-cyclohexene-1-carboxylic-acid synthase [Metabacillus litoralis]QNF26610.1 2-succinyl-5-enolpyruvyl-6-hydroxy-3-cyclohexene-1-carboxylic-acid synthase [Metabacillus sp. KUDC1714]